MFGAKPIHLQSPEEKERAVPFEEMRVDIGAEGREEALAYVRPGDPVVFDSPSAGSGTAFSKARPWTTGPAAPCWWS